MLRLLRHTATLAGYRIVLSVADRISRLPRHTEMSDVERLLRENLALKAQIEALVLELKAERGRRPEVSLRTRAAQVFAAIITRGNTRFRRTYLSASRRTLRAWKRKLLGLKPLGRPPVSPEIEALVVRFKRENPLWGAPRIQLQLRRLGIPLSQPTIQSILRKHGFDPLRRKGIPLKLFRSNKPHAMWALDFFSVRLARGSWAHVLLMIDVCTREIVALRAFPGRAATSVWTTRQFVRATAKHGYRPKAVVHDRGTQFAGQFRRQMAVLDVEQRRTPPQSPRYNAIAERAIKTVRSELLDHVVAKNTHELNWYLSEFQRYYLDHRPHQGIAGLTPTERASNTASPSNVISLDEFRSRRVERIRYANGLLNTYHLTGPPDTKLAA